MTVTKKKQINVMFPYKVYRSLYNCSKNRGISVSDIVREAVNEYLGSRVTSIFGEEEK